MKISVVVPVFNHVHLTQRCLPSLVEGAHQAHQLVIIDNHSTDNTPEYLREFKKKAELKGWSVIIVTNEKNLGVGAAFNQGIKNSTGDFIALLNNDTWLMPNWDSSLLLATETLGGAMIAPYYDETPFDEKQIPLKAQQFIQRNYAKHSHDWAAILMFFRRDTFEKVGVFDERYFVGYEDRDLQERMDRAGLKYYKTGSCFIWHHSKGTRDSANLPSGYEQDSLQKFISKWGFDPRPLENTKFQKYRRKWIRFKNKFGYF
ncbi:MAG: glycosyltransferase family 2 protein [Oligoflexia bacterium]|nr:glycosyltransferase family 2 protein [Oligoflexia bacterium]